MSEQPDLYIRHVQEKDLTRCFEIESVAYAGEEAATKEKILTRIHGYPEGFLVLEKQNEIIGFINSGATDKVVLSDEAFKELVGHDSNGKHVVVMSVVIHPDYQGQSMTTRLMTAFIEQMKGHGKESIYLICQTQLVDMYAKYGFVHLGESDSSHGGLSWHEMSLTL